MSAALDDLIEVLLELKAHGLDQSEFPAAAHEDVLALIATAISPALAGSGAAATIAFAVIGLLILMTSTAAELASDDRGAAVKGWSARFLRRQNAASWRRIDASRFRYASGDRRSGMRAMDERQ